MDEFELWWQQHGQYCRAGGGDYEKTFAFRAWEAALNRAIELMPGGSVTDPQWVCDKLRELGGTRGA